MLLLLTACDGPGGFGVTVQGCVKETQVHHDSGDRWHCEGETPVTGLGK